MKYLTVLLVLATLFLCSCSKTIDYSYGETTERTPSEILAQAGELEKGADSMEVFVHDMCDCLSHVNFEYIDSVVDSVIRNQRAVGNIDEIFEQEAVGYFECEGLLKVMDKYGLDRNDSKVMTRFEKLSKRTCKNLITVSNRANREPLFKFMVKYHFGKSGH